MRPSRKARALRLGVHALASIAPRLAASATAQLFLRTPKRPRRPSSFTEGPEVSRIDLGVRGQRLAVWTWGQGPTVLLVHGWGGRAAQLRAFVGPLLESGARVVAFDAPGHGSSEGNELSMPSFAEAIQRVSDVFGPIDGIVAHSLGAAASTLAMGSGLAVQRAVFLGPPASPVSWFAALARFLELDGALTHASRLAVEARVGWRLDDLTAEVVGPRVRTPLLVIHDRDDAEVPWEEGARVAREIASASMISTEGLGHRQILRDAQVVQSAVRFLRDGVIEPVHRAPPACATCGAALGTSTSRLCPDCALQHELRDRRVRWTKHQGASA